ncbi:TIGR02281 family clan AA aspartic protease [Aureimonas sp. AU4]|uniref:TIGR02281 family clan AA aspartic protease n=1 Tax=Aureimonas sp. AU4 TaxID=1638163 RepID=UPI000780893C|nr:TIGR02281 family clan AA aspartic protease [Aureimonas sp. AU4]
MFKSLLVLTTGASLLALAFPSVFERYQVSLARPEALDPAPRVVEAALPAPAPGRALRLRADPDGHFRSEATANGRRLAVLVDTGATYVAMSETTARRIGLAPAQAEFRYEARTANGEARAALLRIDRLALGTLPPRPADVMVLKGNALGDTVLLGMSYLKSLRRYGVADGWLTLEP